MTSRHFRGRIDYLLGTRDRQLSLNVMVNGVPDRLGKSALDERMGQASQDGTGKPRWDRQAKITIGVEVHKSQIVHFSRSAEP